MKSSQPLFSATEKPTTLSTTKKGEGEEDEEEEEKTTCCVCLMNEPNARIRPCRHAVTCMGCTEELRRRGAPCPFCRHAIEGFDLGVYSNSKGDRGLPPKSYNHLRQLASGEGFNEYFRKQFNGNEEPYFRCKEAFDVLEIIGERGNHSTVRESLEQQVLSITGSEDLVKLRALAKLCSVAGFNDMSLLVVACRRILEVLELAMPEEKKLRKICWRRKKKKNDPRKLEILDAFFDLGKACGWVGDFVDARRTYERAKEGYEEQLGRDSKKALEATHWLIAATVMSKEERIGKIRDLVRRIERALGEENILTLDTLNQLGVRLKDNEEYEEAKEVFERCFERRMKVLWDPDTRRNMMYFPIQFEYSFKDYEKAEELFERTLEEYEAQLGKDHRLTKNSAKMFSDFLIRRRNVERLERLEELKRAYPWL